MPSDRKEMHLTGDRMVFPKPVLYRDDPIGSTAEMTAWYTARPAQRRTSPPFTCLYDRTPWEVSDAFMPENGAVVVAWIKKDPMGFEISSLWEGEVCPFRPDFHVGLTRGEMLLLETQGNVHAQDRVKPLYFDEGAGGQHAWWPWFLAPGGGHTVGRDTRSPEMKRENVAVIG